MREFEKFLLRAIFMVAAVILLAFLILVYSFQARAADLPVKAAATSANPRTFPQCGSGIYLGLGTTGSAGAVAGSPVPGASIVQGEIGVTVGYTSTLGTCGATGSNFNDLWFVEANFYLTNLNGTSSPGLNLTGPADLFQRVGYSSAAINTFLSSIPGLSSISTPSLPVLPSGVTAGSGQTYVYGGIHEQDVSAFFVNALTGAALSSGRQWEVSPEFGVGLLYRLSNGVVADVYAGYELQAQGICFGVASTCPGIGNMWRAGVKFNF